MKYDNAIGITSKFQELLNNGISTYENPINLVKLSIENLRIIENMISNDNKYNFQLSKSIFDIFNKLNSSTSNGKFKRDRNFYIIILRLIDIDNSTSVFQMNIDDFLKL